MTRLYEQLCRYDADAWARTVDFIAADIAPVDRQATRIWFAFYPLKLQLALDAAEDRGAVERKLGLMGRWGLADTIDTSHRFMYGHRYWPEAKAAVMATQSASRHVIWYGLSPPGAEHAKGNPARSAAPSSHW